MLINFILLFCLCSCDQYRWVTKGVYSLKTEQYVLKKRSNAVDSANLPAEKGDMGFRRYEYWGFRSLFALHYTGNRLVYSSFSHRSAKGDQGNVLKRSAPFVKEKVQELLHHTVLRSDYV